MLGAAVTPLPDSTNLVYRVAPGNPLGLEPGDLLLGYERTPWKRLYPQLLAAGLPVSYVYSWPPSTPASAAHFSMMGIGLNWGLFDTIDVVKFSSGDTLHLPTELLDTTLGRVVPSDQMPVPGVPMPEAPAGNNAVSWGVVQGTNVGYIYVWDWASERTGLLFRNAVHDLIQTRAVRGLVIDFRMNWGGDFVYGNGGLSQLFNFDPTVNLRRAQRNSTTDCMAFALSDLSWGFSPGTLYEYPIAVLIGPGCFSVGDFNALRIRFHPMARLFGKATNGAFVGGTSVNGSLTGGWAYGFQTSMIYSNTTDGGYLLHRGVQPDEEVWLTRDATANGQDAVVARALTWMNTLSYAHDVTVSMDTPAAGPAVPGMVYAASDTLYTLDALTGAATRVGWLGPEQITGLAIRHSTGEMYGVVPTPTNTRVFRVSGSVPVRQSGDPLADSVRITATVANPGQHSLTVSAIVTDAQGLLVDSVLFSHAAGDTLWHASIATPGPLGRYNVSVRTEDITSGTFRRLPDVAWFSHSSLAWVQQTIQVPDLRAIAFSPGDTLFGATTNGRVYRIDLATGHADLVGAAPGLVYSGLSFRPRLGELWACVRTPLDSIFTLNTTTGTPAFVGVTGFSAITSSLAFEPGGRLLALIDNGYGEDYLATLDTVTAAGVIVAGPLLVRNLRSIATMVDSVGTVPVSDQHAGALPFAFAVDQNFPNPFNPSTTIKYDLPRTSHVSLSVYDMLGREVATLLNEEKSAGTHTVQWDASGIASGVYFYRIKAGDFVQTKRMLLMR